MLNVCFYFTLASSKHRSWDLRHCKKQGLLASVEAIHTYRPESICVLADASIWVHQFIKTMRAADGEVLRNAHLLGFFRRICKYAILSHPVFLSTCQESVPIHASYSEYITIMLTHCSYLQDSKTNKLFSLQNYKHYKASGIYKNIYRGHICVAPCTLCMIHVIQTRLSAGSFSTTSDLSLSLMVALLPSRRGPLLPDAGMSLGHQNHKSEACCMLCEIPDLIMPSFF